MNKRWRAAVVLVFLAAAVAGWTWWSRSDAYQIRTVARASDSLYLGMPTLPDNLWLASLVFSGQAARALEAAGQASPLTLKVTNLTVVASSLAQMGYGMDDALLSQALLSALNGLDQIEAAEDRVGPITNVAAVLVALKKPAEALGQIQRLTDGWERFPPGLKANVVARIAEIQSLTDRVEARKYAELAVTLAKGVPIDTFGADLDIMAIATRLGKAGATEEGQAAARLITDVRSRSSALVFLASGLLESRRNDEARAVSLEAVTLAHSLPDADSDILRRAAIVLAEVGADADAVRVLGQAGPSDQAELAVALARGQKIEAARSMARRALEAARTLDDSGRDIVAISASEALAATGDVEEAFGAAESIGQRQYQSRAYSRVAKQLARRRLYRAARLAAEHCDADEGQLWAYTDILREYATALRATPAPQR